MEPVVRMNPHSIQLTKQDKIKGLKDYLRPLFQERKKKKKKQKAEMLLRMNLMHVHKPVVGEPLH